MDKFCEKDVENKLRGILRSSSLIAPCLCDGNSLALDRRLHFLMERAVGGGEDLCSPLSSAAKELYELSLAQFPHLKRSMLGSL